MTKFTSVIVSYTCLAGWCAQYSRRVRFVIVSSVWDWRSSADVEQISTPSQQTLSVVSPLSRMSVNPADFLTEKQQMPKSHRIFEATVLGACSTWSAGQLLPKCDAMD